ncbi:hypothetical protein HDU79_003381 [Rhizoclosmatium sp. JEL0117]|nr:hypothetical protein HDU79_003381 [Rhizoclosmatium sp. JEL0117]
MFSGGRTRLTVLLASLGLLLWLLLSAKSSELGSNHSANIPQTKSKVNQIQAQQPLNNTSKLDPKNLRLTHSECLHHFPSLFAPITKTTQFYKTHGGVDYTDITRIYSLLRGPSNHPAFQVHVAIIANKLYIKEYRPSHPNINRALLILDHLNRILSVSPEPLSDVEFVINISDQGGEELAGPVFSLAREVGNNVAWLMPDFGFNAWPEVGVLSYDVLRDQVEDIEARVKVGSVTKEDKLFWRGAPMHFTERKEALELETNAWADIKELRWSCLSTPEKPECKGLTDHKTIPNHCLYKYLLQTEEHYTSISAIQKESSNDYGILA